MQENDELEYAGFWIRVWASIIDTVLLLLITMPILLSIYGAEYFESEDFIHGPIGFLISWMLPAIAVITFWIYKSATPGKMVISSKIVDAQSGRQQSTWHFIGRYLAFLMAGLPLGLGIIWVAFDKRKQGWHDKLAGTVVVRKNNTGTEKFLV